jgi:xylitol oxidase
MSTIAEPLTNWAGNVAFTAGRVDRPSSVEELQELVARSRRVRVLGSGHSFNRIADSAGTLVSVAGLPRVTELDTAGRTVTVSGGLRYGEVAGWLHGRGHALHNLGSLPHISVAGACATGTHGSGDRNGTLASAVSGVELVTAGGELVRLDRGQDDFAGAVVALGAVGVVTRMTLDVRPAFEVRQHVYDGLPLTRLSSDFEELFTHAYSVSVFTDWHRATGQVWLKARDDEYAGVPQRWLGARLADGPRHPVPGMPPAYCTEQLGVPGPWHERLPHFRMEFTPSSGVELQSEYFVPRSAAPAAFEALRGIGDWIAPVLQVSEVRTIAADELWLSASQGRATVGLHFTWRPDLDVVLPALALIERVLAPYDARPHWGKVFVAAPETVRERYPRSGEFIAMLCRYDPGGRFRNEYLDRYLPMDAS